jgi:hypothetical protein
MPAGASKVINLNVQRFFGTGTIAVSAGANTRIDTVFSPT